MQLIFLIDTNGLMLKHLDKKLLRHMSPILGSQYTERMQAIVLCPVSRVFMMIWKIICVFLHPDTAAKLLPIKKNLKGLDGIISADQLESRLGGSLPDPDTKSTPTSLVDEGIGYGNLAQMTHVESFEGRENDYLHHDQRKVGEELLQAAEPDEGHHNTSPVHATDEYGKVVVFV